MKKYLSLILTLAGLIMILTGLGAVFPSTLLEGQGGHDLAQDMLGVFYVRHWCLLVFCMGALLLYAVKHPEIQRPVMSVVAIEKIGLAIMIAFNWNAPELSALHMVGLVDGSFGIVFAFYLLTNKAIIKS